jgi:DNA-binding protein HU-beta
MIFLKKNGTEDIGDSKLKYATNAERFRMPCRIKKVYLCGIQITTMNKAGLVNQIAEDAGISKKQATSAIESFMEGVTKTLRSGKKVTLVGFGTFSVTKRAARKGRNPATGAAIRIKAKKVAKFRAGKELSSKL